MSFEQKLRALRLEHNLTQDYIAEKMNVARSTIAGYETKGRQPSHEKLTALADIFHVSVDYLIDDRETVTLTPSNSNTLLDAYHSLSLQSKQDLLAYIHLLKLRDRAEDQV